MADESPTPSVPRSTVTAHAGGPIEITSAVGEGVFKINGGEPNFTVTRATQARRVGQEATIARSLSLEPEYVASQVRRLIEAIKYQLASMPATPNEPDRFEFHNGLIDFLEGLVAELNELAETLDKMIANRGNSSEPIFLGKAALIADHISTGAMDYIANNREKLAGWLIQGGLIGAATMLVMSLGIDKELLEAIAKIFGKGSK